MQVQINSDNNISMHTKLSDSIGAYINNVLQRFAPYLTRVEVHLTDENSKKSRTKKINDASLRLVPNAIALL